MKRCERYGQIQFDNTLFGSNGLEKHPKYIIPNFTRRVDLSKPFITCRKYIVNSHYEFRSLNVHHAEFADHANNHNGVFVNLGFHSENQNDPFFTFNHYSCQSKEYWQKIKCLRGDVNNQYDYNSEFMKEGRFHEIDADSNVVEDFILYEQNKILYETVLKDDD